MKPLRYLALVLMVFFGLIWLSQEEKPTRDDSLFAQSEIQFFLKGKIEDPSLSYAEVQDTVAWYFERVRGLAERKFELNLTGSGNPGYRQGIDPNFHLSSEMKFHSQKDKWAFFQGLAREEGIEITYLPGKGKSIAGLLNLSLPIPGSSKKMEINNLIFMLGHEVWES